jgi:hypothetical protein
MQKQKDWPYFRCQTFEESGRSLIFQKIFDNDDSRNFVLKVGILDARFHGVERCCYGDGRYGSCDGGHEILDPSGSRIVGYS